MVNMRFEKSLLVALCPLLLHQVSWKCIESLLVACIICVLSTQVRFVGILCVHGSQVATTLA